MAMVQVIALIEDRAKIKLFKLKLRSSPLTEHVTKYEWD